MVFTIIAAMSAFMLVVVAVMYVRDVFIAKRSFARLRQMLLELRMKAFLSYKDNRRRQKAFERADAYLQRARTELGKRNWVGARSNAESGLAVLAEIA